ncbi:UNKNOWN [Stylonychia lemnae]|uniref:Uncharacterized protein n=1 Tax=Stylonychia lemnae TaxID=5949 RepID=A0A078B240_STYLE|nr:UNKNOWN [Stylonychia lemnae]|eukprot:CDW87453.1 UNKNOWN [Stylonychia lemnae]
MSLVDQFLADDNEELIQYTQPAAVISTQSMNKNLSSTNFKQQIENNSHGQSNSGSASGVSRKQMLQDFKKKYNFYNDSSSEEEIDEQDYSKKEDKDEESDLDQESKEVENYDEEEQEQKDQEHQKYEEDEEEEEDDEASEIQHKDFRKYRKFSDESEDYEDQKKETNESAQKYVNKNNIEQKKEGNQRNQQKNFKEFEQEEDQKEEDDLELEINKKQKISSFKEQYKSKYSDSEDSDDSYFLKKQPSNTQKQSQKNLVQEETITLKTQESNLDEIQRLKNKYRFTSSDEDESEQEQVKELKQQIKFQEESKVKPNLSISRQSSQTLRQSEFKEDSKSSQSLEDEQFKRFQERERQLQIQQQQILQQQEQQNYQRQLMQQQQSDELDKFAEIKNRPSLISQKKSKRRNNNDSDDEDGSELDFYQLSDIDTSNLLQSTVKKQRQNEDLEKSRDYQDSQQDEQQFDDDIDDHPILKSSIAKVASLLDSQVLNYDRLLSDRSETSIQKQNGRIEQNLNEKHFSSNEITFNDLNSLSSSKNDQTYQNQQQRVPYHKDQQEQRDERLVIPRQNSSLKQQQPVYQSVIKEEDLEESSIMNESLNYSSQASNQNMGSSYLQSKLSNLRHQTFNYEEKNTNKNISMKENKENYRVNSLENKTIQNPRINAMIIRLLLEKKEQKKVQQGFNKWKELQIKGVYESKLKNAAMMVDKMSKFSRSFISLNSLSQIIQKNKQRVIAKSFIKWIKNTAPKQIAKQQDSSNDKEFIRQLQDQLNQKDQEIYKMEQMFKEYSNWKQKLEQIEQKMKQECDYWRSSCEKLQKENEKLQKEAIKITQNLMERTKDIESKQITIDSLQKKLKQAKSQAVPLDTVEEVVCQSCKNSLEESQIFTGRLSTNRGGVEHQYSQQDFAIINQLNEKLGELEKQVMIYRERVHYHESIEEELKKNIESQVDVVLKMEEERLLLLKENKEMKNKTQHLTFENDDYKAKINLFEKELEELQEQIREQQQLSEKMMQERESSQQKQSKLDESDESDSQSQYSKVINKENKTSNTSIIKKKPNALTNKSKVKKPTQLKFQSTNQSKIGENSAIFSSSLKQAIQQSENDTKSKYGAEPINKQLVTDNQLLTNELVMMGREISKLKAELRTTQETLKKSEKEKYDCRKNLEGKDTAVEKLRKERDELWAVVNTDKYKNLRNLEQDKEKIEKSKQDLENQIIQLKDQIQIQQDQLQKQEIRVQELDFTSTRLKEKDFQREKLLEALDEKTRKAEIELNQSKSCMSQLHEENEQLKQENMKLKKDVDWLANSAKNNKLQAERAINDLEAYTKILRGMEKKLAEVEIEKESKEADLRELRTRKMGITQQAQINQIPAQSFSMINQSLLSGQQINSNQWHNISQQQIPQPYMTQGQQQSLQMWQQQNQQPLPNVMPRNIPQPHQPPTRFQ